MDFKTFIGAAMGAALTLTAFDASALTLRLTDVGTTDSITIVDGGVGDADGTVNGFIGFAGAIGGASTFTFQGNLVSSTDSSGISRLSVANNTLEGSGTLRIEATDVGYGSAAISPDVSNLAFDVNGTQFAGSLAASAFVDTSNVAFGQADQIGVALALSNTNKSDGTTDSAALTNPFSITQILEITQTGGVTLFDATATAAVPIPAGLALMLTALGSVGLLARRRRKLA